MTMPCSQNGFGQCLITLRRARGAANVCWNYDSETGRLRSTLCLFGLSQPAADGTRARCWGFSDRDNDLTRDQLIALALRLDNLLRERGPKQRLSSFHSTPRQQFPSPFTTSAPEPMEVVETHITPQERQRRMRRGLCLYCGEVGHYKSQCQLRPTRGG